MEKIVRDWHILRMIPHKTTRISAGEIHRKLLEISAATSLTKRTIERDLNELANSFPLECDGLRPQGWYWRRDAEALDIPGMDLTAALTFRMVEEFLGRLLPKNCYESLSPHFKRAHTILGDPGHGDLADWPEKVKIVPRAQPLLTPEVAEPVMAVVYEALLRNRRFKGMYKGQGGGEKELEVNPLGLVFNDPMVYVVGTCWDYNDVRLMSLHRFVTAELLDTPVTHPLDFNLQRYIDSGALGFAAEPGATLKLSARFTRGAATHLSESKLSLDQTIRSDQDGWVLVEATVADTDQLRWWLLGFGAQVEVMGPKKLRMELIENIEKLTNLYTREK